jgi:hypothetical protein
MMTKSLAFSLYNHILNIPSEKLSGCPDIKNIIPFLKGEIGTIFTISKFYTFLIRCSLIGL